MGNIFKKQSIDDESYIEDITFSENKPITYENIYGEDYVYQTFTTVHMWIKIKYTISTA